MIYVIRTLGATPAGLKVGFTSGDPRNRLKELQTGCPFKLELVATMSGNMEREKELHEALKDHAMNGEWFLDNIISRKILKIRTLKPLKLGHNKNLLCRAQRMINRLVKKSPKPLKLSEVCEPRKISIFMAHDMPEKKRAFTIENYPYDIAVKCLDYTGPEYGHTEAFLVKKGHSPPMP